MVSMHVVRILVNAVEDAGVPRTVFIRATRLEPAFVQARDARLPISAFHELIELAIDLTGDAAFGLHSIERLADDALDPVSALVAHAQTLGESMRSIQESRRLLGDEASFRVYEERGKVRLRVISSEDEPPRVRRFMAEITVAGLFRTMVRSHLEEHVDEISFAYSAPEYHCEYERIFKGRARFNQPFTGMCFDRQLLMSAAPYPDVELHQALRIFTQRRITNLTTRTTYTERARQFLVWQPPPRDVTMASVARALGTSERSLRRHLREEGTSYSKMVDEALAYIAKRCLLDERCTIEETAGELGFADKTSFHRAFKRWTGLTPNQYRKQQTAANERPRK